MELPGFLIYELRYGACYQRVPLSVFKKRKKKLKNGSLRNVQANFVRHMYKKVFFIQLQTFSTRFILSKDLNRYGNPAKCEMKFSFISTRLPLTYYIKMILYCYKEIKMYVFSLSMNLNCN